MIWKTLSILALVIPVAMVALGLILWRCPPKGPNWLIGFRSRRARASDTVWAFAQNLAGKLWFCLGLILLLVSLLVCNGQREADVEASLSTYLWLIGGQVITLVVVMLAINMVLLWKFDRFGYKRRKKVSFPEDQYPDADEEISYDEPQDNWDEFDQGDAVDDACEEDGDYVDELMDDDGDYEE